MPRPKQEQNPVQVSVSVCLTDDDFHALEQLKKSKNVGRSTLIRKAIRYYLASTAAA